MSIEERIRVTGADQAAQDVRQVADATKETGDAAEQAGGRARRSRTAFSGLTDIFRNQVSQIKSWLGSMFGVAGVIAALRAQTQAAEEARRALEGYVDATAAAVALSKDPKLLDIATQASIASGRGIQEVGPALFAIVSGTAGAAPEQQQALLQESLEIGKAEPQVPLGEIAELLIRLFNVSGRQLSAQQIQNLAIKTEDLGQVDIGQLSRFLPRTLKPGQVAGLELSDTSALFALLSQILKPELAATATENIVSRLAAPTPEAGRVLRGLGVERGAGVLDTIEALAEINRATPLSAQQLRSLVGEGPGAAGLPSVLEQFGQFRQNQAAIQGAVSQGGFDLGRDKVEFLRREVPGFATLEQTRQEQATKDALIAKDKEAAEAARLRARMERLLIEEESAPLSRLLTLTAFDLFRSLGLSPETSVRGSLQGFLGESSSRNRVIVNQTLIGTNLTNENPEARAPEFADVGD